MLELHWASILVQLRHKKCIHVLVSMNPNFAENRKKCIDHCIGRIIPSLANFNNIRPKRVRIDREPESKQINWVLLDFWLFKRTEYKSFHSAILKNWLLDLHFGPTFCDFIAKRSSNCIFSNLFTWS